MTQGKKSVIEAMGEVVRTVDLTPIPVSVGATLRIRIEIVRNLKTNLFTAQAWRIETYRIIPAFPLAEDDALSDEELLMQDGFINCKIDDISKENPDAVLESVLERLNAVL